jgi:hypothetical protein
MPPLNLAGPDGLIILLIILLLIAARKLPPVFSGFERALKEFRRAGEEIAPGLQGSAPDGDEEPVAVGKRFLTRGDCLKGFAPSVVFLLPPTP